MADNRNILVFDFETGQRDPTTAEILQIGAVVINRNNLKIKDEFKITVQPTDFTKLEEEAMKVNHLTVEELKEAPTAQTAFPVFAKWIQRFNIRKDKNSFGAPIPCGWGIDRFDMVILERYCKQYGFWDNKWNNQSLLNPIFTFDCMKHIWLWFRSNPDAPENIKLPTVLEYMGVPKDEIESGAHDALWDVKWTAQIAIRILRVGIFLTEKMENGNRRLEMKGCLNDTKLS